MSSCQTHQWPLHCLIQWQFYPVFFLLTYQQCFGTETTFSRGFFIQLSRPTADSLSCLLEGGSTAQFYTFSLACRPWLAFCSCSLVFQILLSLPLTGSQPQSWGRFGLSMQCPGNECLWAGPGDRQVRFSLKCVDWWSPECSQQELYPFNSLEESLIRCSPGLLLPTPAPVTELPS